MRIWIDAICINQSDDAEKSVQVAMMADIYAGAKNVIVWLGEGTDSLEEKAFMDMIIRCKERAAIIRTSIYSNSPGSRNCFILPLLGKDPSPCPKCITYEQHWSHNIFKLHIEWMKGYFESDITARHNAQKMIKLAIKYFSVRYWKRR